MDYAPEDLCDIKSDILNMFENEEAQAEVGMEKMKSKEHAVYWGFPLDYYVAVLLQQAMQQQCNS